MIDGFCTATGWFPWNRKSTVTWATGFTTPTDKTFSSNVWDSARDYYYKALTNSNDEDRMIFLSQAFKMVGNVLHLLQDMAVPAHVRNDFTSHVPMKADLPWFKQLYEYYVRDNDKQLVDQAIADPPTFTNTKLTDFWDKDMYNGDTTGALTGTDIGLAEFTNANYLSTETIPQNIPIEKHSFPYPAVKNKLGVIPDALVPVIDMPGYKICYDYAPLSATYAPKSPNEKRQYISRTSKGAPCPRFDQLPDLVDQADHFAAVSLLGAKKPQIILDDKVHRTYAKELLPRAIGYSSKLLDYFFRGTLEVKPPAEYIYAITDGSKADAAIASNYQDNNGVVHQVINNHQHFKKMKMGIKNTTPDEEMKDGTLVAVAEYKVIPDYKPDLSTYPPTATMMDLVPFSYSVSASTNITTPLAANAARDFEFNFPDQPIPAGITDLSMYVVFKGTLGNEKDNAIAVAWQSLFEPVHQTFWNLTDRFSLNNVLKTDTEIDNDPTLRAEVDWNANGITSEWPSEPYIKPYPMSFEIGYAANNPPDQPVTTIATVDDVQPGGYIRLITLISEPSSYVKLKSTNATVGVTEFVDIFYGTVCNGYESTFACEAKKTFRNVRQDYNVGLLRCNPLATDASGNKYCSYNESGVALTNFGPLSVGIKFGTQGQ